MNNFNLIFSIKTKSDEKTYQPEEAKTLNDKVKSRIIRETGDTKHSFRTTVKSF